MLERVTKWLANLRPDAPHAADAYLHASQEMRELRDRLKRNSDSELQTLARQAELPAAKYVAIAAESIRRTLNLDPFDVQIAGALAMNDGAIAEMKTGEGKTLAAVLTVFANARDHRGAHVWTANDYLAARDAEWMGPAYRMLGLSVAAVQQGSTAAERRAAYACDVTYCTANEVGFDFLRDQLVLEPDELVQREFAFVLIDEADSILIDEARIPLVIAGAAPDAEDLARSMAQLVAGFRHFVDYTTDEHARNVQLTDTGIAKVEYAFGCPNLFNNVRLFTAVQDAVHAQALLRRDVDYLVRDNAVELIDEFKGRIAQNRRWPAGLQTALEAKERLPLRRQGRILGSITLQNLVRMFPKVCGMTGTAATQAQEFYEMYQLPVVEIPTNRLVIREDYPDLLFPDRLSKERAVVEEIAEAQASGRPVLVGTASVEESERLSARVTRAGVPNEVLNARNDAAEAKIIARAGSEGAVTISTNMAGRGTDIPLGGDRVRELGGLYVIGTNKHEARRIDDQLRGRAGRQGDPGSSRFFVSLDDDLMVRYGIRQALGPAGIRHPGASNAMLSIQRIVEGQNLEIRQTLWKYEGTIDHHRKTMQDRRMDALFRREEMSERERRITLIKIDDLWSDYLAAIAELRAGIHWEAWTGKDPLHTFLTRAEEVHNELEERLEAEIAEALVSEDVEPIADSFDRSATWTYIVNDHPFGTLQERWARAVGDRIRVLLSGSH